jgi:hypothetical protein
VLFACLALSLAALGPPDSPPDQPQPDPKPILVVTASPPVDAQRLGDALRSYLDGYGIVVESAPAAPADDNLREQIGATRRAGESWRAMAAVRVGRGDPESIEIELVDLVTDKSLVVALARPRRDEDLYRALALKIHAVLRATLSDESAPRARELPAVARLVAAPAPAAAPPPQHRLALQAGYLALGFPLGGPTLQGLALGGSFRARRWLELAAGTAVLSSVSARAQDVSVDASLWPLFVTALVRVETGRFQALAGPRALLARARINASSSTTPVQSPAELLAAAGLAVEGRVDLGTATWLYIAAGASAVVLGERYKVGGAPVLDTSRAEASASIGLGVAVH